MLLSDLKYFAENFGWLVAIALVLVLNGDKVAARLGAFIPPLADYLKKREETNLEREKARQEQAEVKEHHVLDSEATWQAQMAKFQDRLLTVIEVDLARSADDGQKTRDRLQHLADVIKDEMSQSRNSLNMFGKEMQLHTQTVAKLADEVEGFRRNGTKRREGT